METDDPHDLDALRVRAIELVARIRIALPYRRASAADLAAVRAALAALRAATAAPDDVVAEVADFADLLDILTTPSGDAS